jgi:hypothetical protein
MPNRGGFSWKRATGVTRTKQRISRSTGIPLSKSGRQRKVGKMVTGGCLIPGTLLISLVTVAALLAGCSSSSSQPTATADSQHTQQAASIDIAAVRANFTDECKVSIVVDDLFCTQVKVDAMTADGTTLIVPTTLNAAATDRAAALCDMLAVAHSDGNGNDLGYGSISILDEDGGDAAACSIR